MGKCLLSHAGGISSALKLEPEYKTFSAYTTLQEKRIDSTRTT
jgi:hypothetical protein